MAHILTRTVITILGFCAATLTAMLMLIVMGAKEIAGPFISNPHPEAIYSFVDVFEGMARFMMTANVTVGFLPSLIAILIGEVAHIRTVVYYMLAGGLALLAIPYFHVTGDGISQAMNQHYITIFAASGFIAGFVYWAIAGRKA